MTCNIIFVIIFSIANNDAYRKEHAWEKKIDSSWSDLQEDKNGTLMYFDNLLVCSLLKNQERKRRKTDTESETAIRRRMIRYTCIIIDLSEYILTLDYRPHPLVCIVEIVKKFIIEYYDRNPLSQISIFITKDGKCVKLTQMSSLMKTHLNCLDSLMVNGFPTLYDSLSSAYDELKFIPAYGFKDIILIWSSLTIYDKNNIFDIINKIKEEKIRCSVYSLTSELFILKTLANDTKGEIHICIDQNHFKQVLFEFNKPSSILIENQINQQSVLPPPLILMGFPEESFKNAVCVCCKPPKFVNHSYVCPVCKSHVCNIPIQCNICHTLLSMSSHLTRSYHHIYPIPSYIPIGSINPEKEHCYSCLKNLNIIDSVECNKCHKRFCSSCDEFIHNTLFLCPGCDI